MLLRSNVFANPDYRRGYRNPHHLQLNVERRLRFGERISCGSGEAMRRTRFSKAW
jgi:hypothetical protein